MKLPSWLMIPLGLLALAMLGIWLGVSQDELVDVLGRCQWLPLLYAALGRFVILGLQALRWWIVARTVVDLTYGQAFRGFAIAYAANTFLWLRGGDLLRIQYLSSCHGHGRARLLATMLVDFLSHKWGWIVAFPLVCLLDRPPSWLLQAAPMVLLFALGVASILGILGSSIGRDRFPESWRSPRWLNDLRDGFATRHWKRLLLMETLVAPLPWIWETFVITVAGQSLGLSLSMMQAFAVLTAFNIAIMIPIPGNAGTYEAGGALALVALGFPREPALAFSLVYHMSQVVPGVALGAGLLLHRASLQETVENVQPEGMARHGTPEGDAALGM